VALTEHLTVSGSAGSSGTSGHQEVQDQVALTEHLTGRGSAGSSGNIWVIREVVGSSGVNGTSGLGGSADRAEVQEAGTAEAQDQVEHLVWAGTSVKWRTKTTDD
jgi:hypothetical protein